MGDRMDGIFHVGAVLHIVYCSLPLSLGPAGWMELYRGQCALRSVACGERVEHLARGLGGC